MFRRREFIKLVEELVYNPNQLSSLFPKDRQTSMRWAATKTTLFPDLTNFKHISPCHIEQQRSWPSKRTTNNRSTKKKLLTAVVADSQVVNCNRFSYQQVIHILRALQASKKILDLKRLGKQAIHFPIAWLNHPKSVPSVKADTSITRIKKSQPSLCRRHTGQETIVLRSTFKGYKSTDLERAITINSNHYDCPFRLSFHMIGKGVCLVMLWPNPARRDKPWNYIALKFQRYTKHLLAMGNLYRHIENN